MRVIVVSTDDRRPTTRRRPAARRADPRRRRRRRERGHRAPRLRRRRRRDEESLVTGLLLPDAPVVAWWPNSAPDVPRTLADRPHRAAPDHGCLGAARPAGRRCTHLGAQLRARRHRLRLDAPHALARAARRGARPAAVRAGHRGARSRGAADSPSTTLLAAWLRLQLDVPVDYELTDPSDRVAAASTACALERASRRDRARARRSPASRRSRSPDQPAHDLALPRRSLRDCLAEELRRLDPDDLYGEVITRGLALDARARATRPDARRRRPRLA